MKYLYNILFTTIVIVLQLTGRSLWEGSKEAFRTDARSAEYRMPNSTADLSPPTTVGADIARDTAEAERQYGLHYDGEENSWTLYATVLRIKKTSVYGRPGEIAQIEYSLDGEMFREGWIVLKLDDYSFVDDASDDEVISIGQSLELYISGVYVSERGLDWEKCPKDDTYCMYAGFVEGGFPISEDYDGLILCPSNTIIRSGFLPGDWINGMLAWKVRT